MRIIGLGAGGHAKMIIEILQQEGHTLAGLLDADHSRVGEMFHGLPILGNDDLLRQCVREGITHFFLGLGGVQRLTSRSELYRRAINQKMIPLPVVHPTAIISQSSRIGHGIVALVNVVVNADSVIGENVLLNTGCIVEHDCVIGDNVHISSRAILLGAVEVGDDVLIGAGAVIRQGVTIGAGSIVGAGAVVVEDVGPGQTVVGVPAKLLSTL